MGIIFEDTRQKMGKHKRKNKYFIDNGFVPVRCQLPFGDYTIYEPGQNGFEINTAFGQVKNATKIVVDTKKNIEEFATNVATKKELERFKTECQKAKDAGVKLVILIENSKGVKDLNSLRSYRESTTNFSRRHGRQRFYGADLIKKIIALESSYNVKVEFCAPANAGERVLKILKGENETKDCKQ